MARFPLALSGAALGWITVIVVTVCVDARLLMLLVFWPIYGIHFLLSGLVAALVVALLGRRWPKSGILLAAALLTITLFAALPLWLASSSTRI